MTPRPGSARTCAVLVAALCTAGAASAADVLTNRNDNARTGVNSGEKALTTANVAAHSFGRLWSLYADGQVVAQPLYVSGLAIDTSTNPAAPLVQGTFNAVVVATMHNTVYLYDADRENRQADGTTKPLWARWLGPPRPSGKDIDMWSTNDPEWGIVGTPVVDAAKTTLWVVAWHGEGGVLRYRLHALRLRDGMPRVPPVVVGGEPPAANPCQLATGLNPCTQKQRPALLLDRGTVYVAFGGDGNRGLLFAFDAATLAQRAVWSSAPTGQNGGIWQSGQGPAADADGFVYLLTGNGTFDADQGGPNYGDSFVKLKLASGALSVVDYFTPCNQKFMNDIDLDLGSGGAVLVPGTNLVYGGGKPGVLHLLSRSNMGKFASAAAPGGCANPKAVQEFQATDLHVHGAGTTYGHIHGSPVFWKGPGGARAYVWGENDRLKSFRFANGKFLDVGQPQTSTYRPPDGMPGGMLAVSSDGAKPGTGIVWAVVPLDGDANEYRGVRGVVLALDAQDVTRQLWSSELSGPRDRLGLFAKYVPVTVAGGKVFVATYGDAEPQRRYLGDRPTQLPARYSVAVYGLLPHEPPAGPITNQDRDDVTVTKAELTGPVALDVSACSPVDVGTVDCTAALEAKLGAPSLKRILVPTAYDFAGCMALRVTTASKAAGLVASTGIGWYAADATPSSQAMTTGRFVPSGRLQGTGAATLKGGAPAVLHDFVALASCSADAQTTRDLLFKPYMQFENSPDGKVFRNWDLARNYRIGRDVPRFDRSADVLAP
jgi:hypothetical protein